MDALIVDDEPLARLRLRTMLAEHADVRIVGECGGAMEAATAIERRRPDVVFLDVQMPRTDGFGLLRSLPPAAAPHVIFVTAHAGHAVQAFEIDAVDYLLKPYDDARLAVTVGRARALLNGKSRGTGVVTSSYQMLELVGSGSMGQVYKAHDQRLRRTVAIKLLAPELSGEQELERRFLQEAKTAAVLDHPNVCTLLGAERTDDGRPFLVMPFYSGETVKAKIARGPLPIEEARDYALQTAAGLSHAHTADIVHRDIKPANLMVTASGLVKILDFGIAKVGSEKLTQAGVLLGTLAYMSPEQAAGEPVDHKTDLWALGAVLYEMLTGNPPFAEFLDGDLLSLFCAIQLRDPAPIRSLRPEVPEALATIVHQLLQKDPTRRPQDATTVERMLADDPGSPLESC
jgi:serine/threonine protein kinase